MISLLTLILAAGLPPDEPAAPTRMLPQEGTAPRPAMPEQKAKDPPLFKDDLGGGLLDFDWFEFHARLGLATFTDDFRIDPSFYVSLTAHAPISCLSPSSNPGGDYFGVFLGIGAIPGVERKLDPPPSNAAGTILLVNTGIDFTILRNQSLYVALEAGGQYASYGGIADLDDGIGLLTGLTGGVYVGGGLTLSASAELVFVDASDRLQLFSLDLVIEF